MIGYRIDLTGRRPKSPKSRKATRADFDLYNDYPLVMNHLTVFELDELPPIVSPLVQADGQPIVYYALDHSQGFIGFLKPSWADDTDAELDDDDAATE